MIVCAEMVQPLPLGLVINEWQVELHRVCGLCQCQEEGEKNVLWVFMSYCFTYKL